MQPKDKDRLLTVVLAAMLILGTYPGFVVAEEPSLKQIQGNWCEENTGCARWWTLYRVQVNDEKSTIKIAYRDSNLHEDKDVYIFEGTVKRRNKWSFVAEIPKDNDGADAASKTSSLKKLTATVGLEGENELTAATAEIIRRPQNDKEETLRFSFIGSSDGKIIREKINNEGEAAESTYDAQIKIEGGEVNKLEGSEVRTMGVAKLTGKIAKLDGEKIYIDAKFKVNLKREDAGWDVDGIYTPPPERCSAEPGKFRTPAERTARRERNSGKITNVAARKITSGLMRSEKKGGGASEVVGRGRFTRRVSGTVVRNMIVLNLPPLPVLNDNCAVVGEIPKGDLKLVKQH